MSCRVSSRVSPTATHPGRSGANAPKPLSLCSMTTTYSAFIGCSWNGPSLLQHQSHLPPVRRHTILRGVWVGGVPGHGVAVGVEAGFDADGGREWLAPPRIGGGEVAVARESGGRGAFCCGRAG